jgi:hypothetical protein
VGTFVEEVLDAESQFCHGLLTEDALRQRVTGKDIVIGKGRIRAIPMMDTSCASNWSR